MKKLTALLFCFSTLPLSAADEGKILPYREFIKDRQASQCKTLLSLASLSTFSLEKKRTSLVAEIVGIEGRKNSSALEDALRDQQVFVLRIEKNIIRKLLGEDTTTAYNFNEALKALERAKEKEAFCTVQLRKSITPQHTPARATSCPNSARTPMAQQDEDDDKELAKAFAPLSIKFGPSAAQKAAEKAAKEAAKRRAQSCPEPRVTRVVSPPAPFFPTRNSEVATLAIDEDSEVATFAINEEKDSEDEDLDFLDASL